MIKIKNPKDNGDMIRFFEEINASIGIEDDKDVYEDFRRIMESSNDKCTFMLVGEEIDGRLASGASLCIIEGVSYQAVVIIYLFTNKDFRKLGLASKVISSIIEEFPKSFFLAEVLDSDKTDPEQEAFEKQYSGLEPENREGFWCKNHFVKIPIDYYNPSPDIHNHCNGIIRYNSLWMNNVHGIQVDNQCIADALKTYFEYGYCAGETKEHDYMAYHLNKEQLLI